MWGKPTRHFKSRWYPAIAITSATVLCLVSAWIVLGRSLPKVPTESTELDQSQNLNPGVVPSPQPEATPSVSPSPALTPFAQASTAPPTSQQQLSRTSFTREGVLRVSNPTDYPIRVALLAQKSAPEESANKSVSYNLPAHWDFAPQEGATKGLIVSLPDRTLKLKQGDVLVAFAQDGSRRYWGPYVVGETEVPLWNPKAAEWELILQP